MKKTVFVGFFFVLFSLVYPFAVGDGLLYVDIIPAFLGFLLIALGLDGLPFDNRRLRDAGHLATGFSVLAFVLLLGELTPFYGFFVFTLTGDRAPWLRAALTFLQGVWANGENLFLCLWMVFTAFFCFALSSELKRRVPLCDASFTGKRPNAYGDMDYSQRYVETTRRLSTIFTAVYVVLAVLYAVNGVYALVNLAAGKPAEGFVLTFYDFKFGLWAFLWPVHILFMIFVNRATAICAAERRHYD